MKTILALLTLALLAGCAGLNIRGQLLTPYGTISSDGKTVTVAADTRGFAK